MPKTIAEWQKEVHALAVEKGWWDEGSRNIGELIALMHSELSEALEEYRSGRDLNLVYYAGKKPMGFPIELADCMIRIMDTCESLGIDLDHMLSLKHQFNKTRAYRHGGKKA